MTAPQRRAAWPVRHASSVSGTAAVVLLALVVLELAAALSMRTDLSNLVLLPGIVAFIVAGWVLTHRTSGNAVGWLLLLTSVGLTVMWSSAVPAWLVEHDVAAGRWIGAVRGVFFVFIVGGLGLLLPLLFPNGRLPSTRRRWWIVLGCDLGYMLFAAFNLFDRGPLDLPGLHHRVQNPFGTPSLAPLSGLVAVSAPMLLIGFIGSFASMVIRWRTADPTQREQVKWVIAALGVGAVPFLLNDWAQTASNVAFTLALPLTPIAVAVSVLRYRLYDIDRIVSRAVSYLLVTGLLVAVYVGLVGLAEAALPVGSSAGVAASTLAAAALFQPVRRRVQDVVDHRFNRARYDAARTIDAFAVRLRDEVDPDVVRRDLVDVASVALQPASISLWVAP
jgi:hypothetical protein